MILDDQTNRSIAKPDSERWRNPFIMTSLVKMTDEYDESVLRFIQSAIGTYVGMEVHQRRTTPIAPLNPLTLIMSSMRKATSGSFLSSKGSEIFSLDQSGLMMIFIL